MYMSFSYDVCKNTTLILSDMFIINDKDLDLTENKRIITETLRFINDSKRCA